MATEAGEPGVLRVLVRHFNRQFFSLDSVATGGEVKEIVAAILTLLAAPGYLLAVVTLIGGPRLGQYWKVAGLHPLLVYWKEEWLVFTLSMAATAVLAAIHWRSFVLDARDYRILGPLPLRRRTVLLAKLASLAFVVLVLHAGVNLLSGTFLPMVSPAGYWRTLPALQLALLLQTVFACACVLALQAIATTLLPAALARRSGTLVQFVVLLAVALLVVSADSLSEQSLALRDTPHPLHVAVPVAWFMALYKGLLGFESPQLAADARLALIATAAVVVVAAAGCLAGYRDLEGRSPAVARVLQRWSARVDRLLVFRHPRAPRARGISAFIGKATWRDPTAALISRGWLVVGIAVVLAGFAGAQLRGQLRAAVPVASTVAPGIVLSFFGLVGLRLAASYPVQLDANWLFRVTETTDSRGHAAAIRWAAVRGVVLPVLAVATLPQLLLWGATVALPVALLSLAIGLVTAEWLFLGFGKIPFTCTYLPGKANLRVRWPVAAAVALVYCVALPEIVAGALPRRDSWLTLLVLLALLWGCLLALAHRGRRPAPLVFDERAAPLVTQLRLDD